jgi:hypothetical protein
MADPPALPPPTSSTRDAIVVALGLLLSGGGLAAIVRALRSGPRRVGAAKPEEVRSLSPGEAQILERLAQIEGLQRAAVQELRAEVRSVVEAVLRDLLTARKQEAPSQPTGLLTPEEAEHVSAPPTRRR